MKKLLTAAAVGATISMMMAPSVQAEELHFVMCGGEVREADQKGSSHDGGVQFQARATDGNQATQEGRPAHG